MEVASNVATSLQWKERFCPLQLHQKTEENDDSTVVTTSSSITVQRSNVSNMSNANQTPPYRSMYDMIIGIPGALPALQQNHVCLIISARQLIQGFADVDDAEIVQRFQDAMAEREAAIAEREAAIAEREAQMRAAMAEREAQMRAGAEILQQLQPQQLQEAQAVLQQLQQAPLNAQQQLQRPQEPQGILQQAPLNAQQQPQQDAIVGMDNIDAPSLSGSIITYSGSISSLSDPVVGPCVSQQDQMERDAPGDQGAAEGAVENQGAEGGTVGQDDSSTVGSKAVRGLDQMASDASSVGSGLNPMDHRPVPSMAPPVSPSSSLERPQPPTAQNNDTELTAPVNNAEISAFSGAADNAASDGQEEEKEEGRPEEQGQEEQARPKKRARLDQGRHDNIVDSEAT